MILLHSRRWSCQAYRRVAASHNRASLATNVPIGKKKGNGKHSSKYSHTVLLPETSFGQRANSLIREPELQAWWSDQQVYEKLFMNNTGDYFTLHDGPPYANGELHIGHAMNKILKDVINKYKSLRGHRVKFVPGWDTHGLPIELKVLQGMKSKEREELTPISLRKKAAEFALQTMLGQRSAFQRYGVWADWGKPYLTLQPEYEAKQIAVFGEMVQKGHIYRGKKPVHWSPSSRSALAEAELEYPENHVSKSIYLGFKVRAASPALAGIVTHENIFAVIWTTTPWTIPANLAVAVNDDIDYCVACTACENDEGLDVIGTLKGSDLVGTLYEHPLFDRVSEIITGGDYITTESGTGLVHTAPGHGMEDYLTGLKHDLPLLSPVDDSGRFTDEVGERFAGLDVLKEGNTEVINALKELGCILAVEDYTHKYPYDWRTKRPTIFRATEQWFSSVSTFRDEALQAIDGVDWVPSIGRNRIASMVKNRGDWCISRQRHWGVPIPVFYSKVGTETLLSQETLKHIEDLFREHGSDCWWTMDVADLLPPSMRHLANDYSQSGLNCPADLYLEGSDQHRGWFQSSLLTSVASRGKAPYKQVLTHGFVLDGNGRKMSKSIGNVVDPNKIIEGGSNRKRDPPYGADILRLWINSVDYTGDVRIGDEIVKQTSDNYRKLRNTLRYLLGSLHGFVPEEHAVPISELASIDKYILATLSETITEMEGSYDSYSFYKASHALLNFASHDLSAFYLDMAKDRLYVSAKDEERRRSCQTVIQILVETLAVLMAPIVPHMAEDVWQNLPYQPSCSSVFYAPKRSAYNHDKKMIQKWKTRIGASQECQVFLIQGDRMLLEEAQSTDGCDDLRFVLMASQVTVVDSELELIALGLSVGVARAKGRKCDRCWYYSENVGHHAQHSDLCLRCAAVLEKDNHIV
eukprot:GSChrysophyteH1.ASY1.ANO1.2375.1 assembled CDS